LRRQSRTHFQLRSNRESCAREALLGDGSLRRLGRWCFSIWHSIFEWVPCPEPNWANRFDRARNTRLPAQGWAGVTTTVLIEPERTRRSWTARRRRGADLSNAPLGGTVRLRHALDWPKCQSVESPGSEVSRTNCPKGSDARTCLRYVAAETATHLARSSSPTARKLSDLRLSAKARAKNISAARLHLLSPIEACARLTQLTRRANSAPL